MARAPRTIPIRNFLRLKKPDAKILNVSRFNSLWMIPFSLFFLVIGYVGGVASGSSGSHRAVTENVFESSRGFDKFARSVFLSFDATDPEKPGMPQVIEKMRGFEETLLAQSKITEDATEISNVVAGQCQRLSGKIIPAFDALANQTASTQASCDASRQRFEELIAVIKGFEN